MCAVPLLPAGLTYVDVWAGWQHAIARRSDGSLVEWGESKGNQQALARM